MFSIPNYIKESGFDARNRKKVKICCPVISIHYFLVKSVSHCIYIYWFFFYIIVYWFLIGYRVAYFVFPNLQIPLYKINCSAIGCYLL
jgi:hypothetical protein